MSTPDAPGIPDVAAATPRTAYLVLGMHRSGTSAVSQLLSLAGAELPKNVMPGDDHNAQGYFEPWRIALFNDERLRAAGSAWDDAFAFPCPEAPPRQAAEWRRRAIALFDEEYTGRRHPLVKDPRVSILLPFWREALEALGVGVRCVIPVRHPMAVAASLARRDGFTPEKSVLLWCAYMLAAEAYSRDLPRAVVGYDRVLANWRCEVARIERAHGASLPRLTGLAEREIDDALTLELRHNRPEGDLRGLGWIGEIASAVYDWFAAAAVDGAPDASALDAVAAEFADRRRQIAALVSPAARDLDAARAEAHALRQSLAWDRRELELLKQRLEAVQRDWWAQRSLVEAAEQALDSILHS